MKKVYFPQHGGINTEQNLVQDLVDEQIKLFGSDVFYIPRVHLKDKSLGEIIQSEFNQSYMIEMFLVNVEGFGAGNEFVSKFGLRITDEITFVVSRRRWEQSANPALNLAVDGRPNEGDLIYFPLTEDLYEIKYVERENPFFQLGKQYFYQLTAEIYEQGADKFDTGIDEIDAVERDFSNITTLNLTPSTRVQATGSVTVNSSGEITGATVDVAGTGYSTPPSVTINGANGSGGIITTSIADGGVVTLTVINGGTGYQSDTTSPDFPTITIDAPPLDVQFLNDEHVVIGGYVQQGGGRSWTSANNVVTVTALGNFDATFATITQKKYFYWMFEDKRLCYVYTYNGTSPTTVAGHFYYDETNVQYIINTYEETTTSGSQATMYDLDSATIAEVADWNGVEYKLEVMNRTGNFIDGDTIRGVESNALYTLGTFSTINNESIEYDQNQSIEDGADDLIDWGETNPFGEFGNYTGSF
tara:strand:- start:1853 stop:3271 length:1419 start_codon:yes stop_codon:yes gene_type:complete